ncbi:MAG: DNA-3-methyladenine glycosylase [Betaproteobacteria bacterium]|nr:DNA-3-methyladenine glycosylase [Betaproteobacteria bacterium]
MAKAKSSRDAVAPKERVKRKEPRRLDRAAFNRTTLQVARDLLGKFIVRSYRGRNISGMITEVEAYKGPRDAASHARGGRRTARVEPLYAAGGTVYVYFIYGIHWMLNFSTSGKDIPEGVLIRGILADPNGERKLLAGPGRVTKYLKIDKKLDGADVTDSKQIWLEDRGVRIPARSIKRGPRIGVDFAGPYWAARPWRFWIERSTAALVTNRLLK